MEDISRYTARCSWGECGDTIRQLADQLHLDPDEYRKWATTDDADDMPASADQPLRETMLVRFPNTVYLNRVGKFPTWVLGTSLRQYNALRRQGFHVVYEHDLNNEAVLSQLSDTNIFGMVNVAHGEEEAYGHGEIETTSTRGIGLNLAKAYLHYKLGGLMIIQCWGDEIDWHPILAPNAYYWAGHGKIHYWQIPPAKFR